MAGRLGLRAVALGYLLLLLAIPVGMVFYRTFAEGIGAAFAAVTTPEAQHAFWLTMIMVLVFAFWSERVKQRSPFIMAGYTIGACGFIAELALPQTRLPGASYGFLFLVAAGLYCPFIQIVSWTGTSSSTTPAPIPY